MTREVHPAPWKLLAHNDALGSGRLMALTSLDDWRRVREDYWRFLYPDGPALTSLDSAAGDVWFHQEGNIVPRF